MLSFVGLSSKAVGKRAMHNKEELAKLWTNNESAHLRSADGAQTNYVISYSGDNNKMMKKTSTAFRGT